MSSRKRISACAIGVLLAGGVHAGPVTPEMLSEGAASRTPQPVVRRGLATEVISVSPLGDVRLDSLGILPAKVLGLPDDFWGDSDPETIARLLGPHTQNALPAVMALIHHILLAELSPPQGKAVDGQILLARVDHLLSAGALDQAEALLERAHTRSAALFRRWFDISLLTGRADRACFAMLADSGLTPNLQSRIFCLFRSGDWRAAALTLRSGFALGKIDATDEALISMFLDPDLFVGEPDPPFPETLTPLNFTMREALALPRDGRQLPLAYLYGDLNNYRGWRNRLIAAERLTRAQAIPYSMVIEAYNEARPSASGGIWERVRVVQSLRAALSDNDAKAVSEILPRAYRIIGQVGLEVALAGMVFPKIGDMALSDKAARFRFRLALLHKEHTALARKNASSDERDRFLVALARGDLASAKPASDREKAVFAALQGKTAQNSLLRLVDDGRKGEAVLRSLHLLTGNRRQDPVAIETGLAVLVRAGLRDAAFDIAVQLLVLDQGV